MHDWRTIRVPASSANLGPGFDALGLALGVYLECRFRPSETLTIRATGLDAGLISTAADNLIWQIARRVGATGPIELEIDNAIPIGKGLGSSAAAVTAGVVIGAEIAELRWDRTRILDEAARIEGHPDNVAPCILGGLVAAAIDCTGAVRAVRHDLHPDYRVAVVVPDFVLPTEKSRQVLPDSYSRADAIFNLQRVALLISALTTGATSVFPAALDDRLHQPYRFPLVPGLEEMTRLRAPGLLGCALSGAGPSVLVFHERGHDEVCELFRQAFLRHGSTAEILHPEVPAHGYEAV
ncbi:MAG: homoserine kinase [Acidobacteriia bacterium]|nr:homoserine kinase [Terriglobia bacterium]